jgi:lipopolysaccharide transport system ATP-binding protein
VRTSETDHISAPIAGVTVSRASDGTICYDTSTANEGVFLPEISGERRVSLHFDRLDLIPGDYFIDVGIYEAAWHHAYDYHWHVYPLQVLGASPDSGVFRPPHRWEVADPVPSSTPRS